MGSHELRRRTLLRGAAAAGGGALLSTGATGTASATTDTHTAVTHRAVVDAVIPETPGLESELGAEHVPGGLAVDLDEFLVTYVDDLFSFGLPLLGPQGNIPLAGPVATVLDVAAKELIAEGDNESEPDSDRVVALLDEDDASPLVAKLSAGPFAELSRRDRLRAISILDDIDVSVSPTDDWLFEVDGGLLGQLVVGFAEVIYYSEWQGYDEFTQSPGEREHPNTADAVQSWRQTGYPGFADGYAALRGYLSLPDSPLGSGEVWTDIDESDDGVAITYDSGQFRENEYDTSGYTEPFPEGA